MDTLYILGDVIDGSRKEWGGLTLLTLIMESQSYVLLLGNHEEAFLRVSKTLKTLLFEDGLQQEYRRFIQCWMTDSKNIIGHLLRVHDSADLSNDNEVLNWIAKGGNKKSKRQSFISAWLSLCSVLPANGMEKLIPLLSYQIRYRSRFFLQELVDLDEAELDKIIRYLKTCALSKYLHVNERDFVLTHWIGDEGVQFPASLDEEGKVVVQGHVPVQVLWKESGGLLPFKQNKVNGKKEYVSTDKSIFCYIDIQGNEVYSIDYEGRGCCLLELESMDETYIPYEPKIVREDIWGRRPTFWPTGRLEPRTGNGCLLKLSKANTWTTKLNKDDVSSGYVSLSNLDAEEKVKYTHIGVVSRHSCYKYFFYYGVNQRGEGRLWYWPYVLLASKIGGMTRARVIEYSGPIVLEDIAVALDLDCPLFGSDKLIDDVLYYKIFNEYGKRFLHKARYAQDR